MRINVKAVGSRDQQVWNALRRQAAAELPSQSAGQPHLKGEAAASRHTRLPTPSAMDFIADRDGNPCGLASARQGFGGEVELTSLWVAPALRGRGIARRLIAAVCDWVTQQPEADRLVVRQPPGRTGLVPLFRGLGFDVVSAAGRPDESDVAPFLSRRLVTRLRVGVHSGQQYHDFPSVLGLWHRAEELGYDWISLFDHLRPEIFGPDGPCMEGFSLLSALASTTPRVRCALMVAPPAWRHPALTATIAATIDQVSGGRLELGVGVGGRDLAFAQYGIPQPPLPIRFAQLDEACHIMRRLWGGGPVDFNGDHFRLRGAHLNPVPLQRRLPLVIGGAGERGTLPLVARHGDVWNCALMSIDSYAHKVEVLSRHCEHASRSPREIRRSLTFRVVIRASHAEAARTRDQIRDDDAHSQDLAEYLCFGTAQECVDRLAPYVRLGVRDFLLGLRPPLDWPTLESFAADVAPALRELAAT